MGALAESPPSGSLTAAVSRRHGTMVFRGKIENEGIPVMTDTNENEHPENVKRFRPAEIEEILTSGEAEDAVFRKLMDVIEKQQLQHIQSAFTDAVRGNKPLIVSFCIKNGANVNATDDHGVSALHIATEKNMTEIVAILLEAGADIELKTESGTTPLDIARRLNHPKTERMLREAKRKRIMQADIYALQDEVIDFAHAVVDGDIVAVKLLIGKGADVNKIVSGGGCETLLHIAVDRNHPEIVAALLKAGADVNAQNNDGETPLHRASLHSPASVLHLIGAGAKVDARDNILDTPLHYAAESNSLETIAALINAGATIDLPGYDGRTPLFEAVFHENNEALKLLIELGADVNYRINLSHGKSNGETPIHAAALYANLEIAKILVDAGADIEAKSARGKKAIDCAIQEKKTDLVVFLLHCGAEVPALADYVGRKNSWAKAELWYRNVKRSDRTQGDTIDLERLCRTIRQGENETSELMIRKRRTAPNAFDKHGYTPLHWAALEGNVKIMETLLECGADMELPTAKGSPTLALAVWRFILNNKRTEKGLPLEREATLDAFRLLLDRGVKVDAVNKAGLSLLHIAARNGEIGIMQRLLDYGADLEFMDNNNRTPLFHAIEADRDRYLAVKFLVDCGAKLNIRDLEHGRTPLHWAALCHANRIVNLLLDAGADRNWKDDKGKTALDYLR